MVSSVSYKNNCAFYIITFLELRDNYVPSSFMGSQTHCK